MTEYPASATRYGCLISIGGSMSKRAVTRWYLLPVVALLCGGSAAAQRNGTTTSGQVTDSSAQRPLAGAEVFTVTGGATTATRGARTDAPDGTGSPVFPRAKS